MTIIDIIEQLKEEGHTISYRQRKDGGYVIRKIDGVHYSNKSGNAMARQMVGVELSVARKVQLRRIATPKGKRNVKKTPLPPELLKQMRKIQRKWRKEHPTIEGTISTRGLRYQYETYGEDIALKSLDKAFRYAEGYAYLENVQYLLERIKNNWSKSFFDYSMEKVITKIEQKMMTFKEDWIQAIYEIVYEWEKGTIDAKECARRILEIIK